MNFRWSRDPRILLVCASVTLVVGAGCAPQPSPEDPPGPNDPDAHYVLLDGVVGMSGTGFEFVLRTGSSGDVARARDVIQSVVDELNDATGSTHRLLAGTLSGSPGPNQVVVDGVPDAGAACGHTGAIGCGWPNLQDGYVVGGNVVYEAGLESNRQLFAHEVGHALGLGHCTPDPAQIMCNDQDALTTYNTGDINGFRWLLANQPRALRSDATRPEVRPVP